MLKHTTIIFLLVFLTNCSDKYDRVPEERFVGIWELEGRQMFNDIQIEISRENGKLSGKIKKLNDNKYVQMLAEVGDIWVSEIKRSSDFQFRLTEKKIGRDLFSLYDLSTSTELRAEFIDENTIGLARGRSDPTESKVVYRRISQ